MSKIMLACLLAIAPLIIPCIMFKRTEEFFDKWFNSVAGFMIDPLIQIGGLAILTNLFVVYLDQAIGYSVCFKCAIPISLPTEMLGGKSSVSDIADKYLFCINWFYPWGITNNTPAGISMQQMLGTLMIGLALYVYKGVCSSVTQSIIGEVNTPTAAAAAEPMSKITDFARGQAVSKIKGAGAYGLRKAGLISAKKDDKQKDDKQEDD
jgi:type IV secretion system protein VirB6